MRTGICAYSPQIRKPRGGGVPTTPYPNTSAKLSRYKWEAYRDQICLSMLLSATRRHTSAKVSGSGVDLILLKLYFWLRWPSLQHSAWASRPQWSSLTPNLVAINLVVCIFCAEARFSPEGLNLKKTFLGLPPLQKCVRDFCCINFGGFCRELSWRIFLGTFSHNNEKIVRQQNPREKIRRLENKNPRRVRSAKNRP